MARFPFIGMVVRGAGEAPFAYFAPRFCRGEDISATPSACFRGPGGPRQTDDAPPYDMNQTRFMYEDLSVYENRAVYYETSRGCPFCCAYCLSAGEPVSLLGTARVERELEHFVASGVRMVRLVDRTFNYPPERCKAILSAMIALRQKYPLSPTMFHIEISACLLDEETLSLLASAPEGLLHIEAGIQSTHAETLRAVRRGHDTQKALRNIGALCAMPNLRVHADLIAGLPKEDYASFSRSFNDAYALRPAELQLGFLKLLHGSALRRDATSLGIVYTDYPPYEVLSTPSMTYGELSALRRIAELTDVLYNSHAFTMSLDRFIGQAGSPFAFFEQAAAFFDAHGFFTQPQPPQRAFELLAAFSLRLQDGETLREALCFDWRRGGGGAWPKGLMPPASPEKPPLRRFFSNPENIRRYLPHCAALAPGQIEKRCRIHAFPRLFAPPGWVLFEYTPCSGGKALAQEVADFPD